MISFRQASLVSALVLLCFAAAACTSSPPTSTPGKIQVVVTTSIIGDVVRNVGKGELDLHILVPPGVDEHSFQYTPEDVARAAEADVIFMSNPQLETFTRPLLSAADSRAKIITLSKDALGDGDPHVWTDPDNVADWVEIISDELSKIKPDSTGQFQANAGEYQTKLAQLDRWIGEQVVAIPLENRKLVSDHQLLDHFARKYGFESVGSIIPSFSTEAAPTARELAALEDTIRNNGIKAIFIGNTANAGLAQQIASDTGVQLVPIYTESLSADDGPANSYLEYMRYNVQAIVAGLK